jgi:uncharacterized protein
VERDLVVCDVAGKGRGVVAGRPFARYSVVASAPVVVLAADDWARVELGILREYAFKWDEETGERAVALSVASLFNHSYEPNTCPKLLTADLRIDFLALRDIDAGEELTFNYNGRPSDRSPLWFEARE